MSNGVPPTERSTIKLALMAQQLRAQLDADGVLDAEPIAIIGLGCRFPGGASSPAQYWQLLESGRDAITAVPEDRWDAGSFEEVPPSGVGTPRVSAPGVRWGGFLDRIREFDAEFFGLSPREASSMDPQQRLLLEVAYEAFEDAGLSRERLQGSHTGVYVASTAFDYAHLQLSSPESISAHSVTGSVHCIIANRLSFLFNLLGPSVTVDTACSSSLVALHMACQGLRDRETALAIAGGVNVILSPEIGLSLSQWGMMAPDGRCKTFDARADGFVRAEGCGVVVLKRLSDALVDGDRVLAVVRGSAVNQDGRSTAMTAPNGLAQQAVMRQALARGAVAPSQVSFVEAHGTGTVLGDPIEVEALAEVYGQPRDDGQPLVLGAVKTNIGHLEAAAGVAGVIKTVLALVHERIPRNLHFERLNPHISLAGTRVVLASEGRAWPMRAGRRIAGVSSFGFGGTNAHVLIEEAPRLPSRAPRELGAVVLPLSAHTETALRERARAMVAYLGDEGGRLPLADVVGTAARRRSHLDDRLAVVGTTAAELGAGLQAWLDGVGSTAVSHGRRPSGPAPRVAFVFSGQGPQWWAMGRELLRDSRVFRDVVEACERVLSPIVGWSLLAELSADEQHSRLDRTDIAQPALFAVQAGLVAQWRAWGIKPAAVAGHSVGEIAAAYAAGVLTLEDAVRVAAERGRAMESARGGRMASLECAAEEVARLLDEGGYGERLVLAAINGPASVVIAGDADAVEAFRAQLGGRDVGWRPLPVPFAFHSPHMASAASALRESLASLAPRPAEIPVVSTVTGRMAEHGDFGAAYWESNVREPVRFHRAMTTLIEAGHAVFVEIGPHPVLTLNVRQVLGASGRTGLVAHSLRRGQPERSTLLTNLGALFAHGCPVEWAGVHDTPHAVVSLPPYPWQRQAYWFEPPRPAASRLRGPASGEDDAPLLGRQLDSPALESVVFQAVWTPDTPLFAHHVLGGAIVAPATALIDTLEQAALETDGVSQSLEGFAISEAMVFECGRGRVVQVIVRPLEGDSRALTLVSRDIGEEGPPRWTSHATAIARPDATPLPLGSLADARALATESVSAGAYYAHLESLGVRFGSAYKGLSAITRSPEDHGIAVGRIDAPEEVRTEAGRFALHPALLDACFQTYGATILDLESREMFLPVGVDRVRIFERLDDTTWCVAMQRTRGEAAATDVKSGDLAIFDGGGRLVAHLEGVHMRRASVARVGHAGRADVASLIYRVAWQAAELADEAHELGSLGKPAPGSAEPEGVHGAIARGTGSGDAPRWLILADDRGVGRAVSRALRRQGARTVVVRADTACASPTHELSAPHGRVDDRDRPVDGPGAIHGEDDLETTEDEWRVHPTDAAHLRHVIDAYEGAPAWKGAIVLWSLDDTPMTEATGCAGLLHVAQALLIHEQPPPVWLVTRGGCALGVSAYLPDGLSPASAWGLAATIDLEHPELRLTCVDLDPLGDEDHVAPLVAELGRGRRAERVAYRRGVRHVARLVAGAGSNERAPAPSPGASGDAARTTAREDDVELIAGAHGVLEELRLRAAVRRTPGRFEVEIRVRAASLNFRDVLAALGMYPGEVPAFGSECAGEVTAVGSEVTGIRQGDEVLAIVTTGAFRRFAIARAEHVVAKPAGLTFEAAAALPSAFLTAMYALRDRACLARGETVLIHAAAGGVGMAALQVARRLGARALATAGSADKRAFVGRLGAEATFDSRSVAFSEGVRAVTDGRGVDVVLNSLSGDLIDAGVATLATNGRFVEIGKRDIWTPARMTASRPDVAYHPFDLSDIMRDDPARVREMLSELVEGVTSGTIEPLPTTRFRLEDAREAFAFMAHARHIGKVVLVDETGAEPVSVRAEGSYLVTGGSGALGQAVAGWLLERGAGHVVVASRNASTATTATLVERWPAAHGRVRAAAVDVADRHALAGLIDEIVASGSPLRGVVHAAGVLDDAAVMRAKWTRFDAVRRPKVHGAWYVHELTRGQPLDFFVLVSSASAVLGAAGQASYAAANAELDALARWRRARGLPATSVGFGPWEGAGMAAAVADRLRAQGFGFMSPEAALGALERLVAAGEPHALALQIDWRRYVQQRPGPPSAVLDGVIARPPQEPAAASPRGLTEAVARTPLGGVRAVLLAHLDAQSRRVLGLSAGRAIAPTQPLQELGLDSLMAVELRNALSAELRRPLPATLLFDYPSLDALAGFLQALVVPDASSSDQPKSGQVDDGSIRRARASSGDEASIDAAMIAGLSEEEAEALLLEELENSPNDADRT